MHLVFNIGGGGANDGNDRMVYFNNRSDVDGNSAGRLTDTQEILQQLKNIILSRVLDGMNKTLARIYLRTGYLQRMK